MRLTAMMFACLVTICATAGAAEILADHHKSRVATGDWAARASRLLYDTPVPSTVNPGLLSEFLLAAKADAASSDADPLVEAIARHGWAQWEIEPEQSDSQVNVMLWVADTQPGLLRLECRHIANGLLNTGTLDTVSGAMNVQQLNPAPLLDRTVYASLASPENFILNQEHFTHQLFTSMLNLDSPGMETVRDAWQKNAKCLALYELAEYYRRKTTPAELIRKPVLNPDSDTHPAGDKICRHEFSNQGVTVAMGDKVEWSKHPKEAKAAEWLWGFNGHSFFVTLMEAYMATRNEKYAHEYVNLICDFIIQNPAPPYTLTRVPTWRNLEAGTRTQFTWPRAFYGFLASPCFTPQAIGLVLGSLWSHGDYILKHPSGMRRPSNWSVVDSSGLVGVSMYFPEFRDAPSWRQTGFERLSRQLDLQVYPDGSQYELAPSYHLMCLHHFVDILLLAQATGFPLDEAFAKQVESMYDYVLTLAMPDRAYPAFGDSGPGGKITQTLLQGDSHFNRPDMRYAATYGKEGEPPAFLSRLAPYAGLAVMRTGWDASASYLCFDIGPTGTSHQHEDMLSFVLHAHGKTMLVDSGPHVYTQNPMRRYCISSAAHNTVMVDGQGQNRIERQLDFLAPDDPKLIWQTDDTLDYAAGAYEAGYGPDAISVRHVRHILFRKPDYWLIIDELTGEGSHDIQTLFHFAPDMDATVDERGVVHANATGGPGVTISPSPVEGLAASIVSGREEPLLGWYAPGGDVVEPTSVAVFSINTPLPARFVYLLEPGSSNAPEPASIHVAESPGGSIRIVVERPGHAPDMLVIDTATHTASVTTQ